MKRFKRDGDYWVIVGALGEEHARFEINKGITEMLIVQWQTALDRHGDIAADWFLHGLCQSAIHCTMLSMENGQPLTPYVSPPPVDEGGEEES